ncbi:UNVERIFIED_CONTAM: hypothetical protein RMT77_006288 [Armadillidium vulgare]
MPYEFGYGVNNANTGDAKEHKETTSENGRTEGEYRWLQPNGLFRVVRYYVEGNSGFIAEVTEEEKPRLKNYMFSNLKSGMRDQPLIKSHSQQIFSYQDKNGNNLIKQIGFKNSLRGNSYLSSQDLNLNSLSPEIFPGASKEHFERSHQQSLLEIKHVNEQSNKFTKTEDNRERFNKVPQEQFYKLNQVLPSQMTYGNSFNTKSSLLPADVYQRPVVQPLEGSLTLSSVNLNKKHFRKTPQNLQNSQRHHLDINGNQAHPQENKFCVRTDGLFKQSSNSEKPKSLFMGNIGKSKTKHQIQQQHNGQMSKHTRQQRYEKRPVSLNIVPIQSFLKNNPQLSNMISFSVFPRVLNRLNSKINILSNVPKSPQSIKKQTFRTISTSKLPSKNLESFSMERQTLSDENSKSQSIINDSGNISLRSLSRFPATKEMKLTPEIIQRLAGKINLLPLETAQNQLINPKVVTTQLLSSLKNKDSSSEKVTNFVAPNENQNINSENLTLEQKSFLNDNNSQEANFGDVIQKENQNYYRKELEGFTDYDFQEESSDYFVRNNQRNYQNNKSLSSDEEAEISSYSKINR